jgi:hypothetical protein
VSASFGEKDDVPVSLLLEWIDESYRAIAPKKLVAGLGARAPEATPAPARKKPARKKPARKKPARKKPAPKTRVR